MAIQPIDLQTMYSQMTNLASKVASEQHSAQNSAIFSQKTAANQNLESIKTVKKSAENESKTGLIKEDAHQNPQNSSNQKSSQKKDEELLQENSQGRQELREDYLGRHINITR